MVSYSCEIENNTLLITHKIGSHVPFTLKDIIFIQYHNRKDHMTLKAIIRAVRVAIVQFIMTTLSKNFTAPQMSRDETRAFEIKEK